MILLNQLSPQCDLTKKATKFHYVTTKIKIWLYLRASSAPVTGGHARRREGVHGGARACAAVRGRARQCAGMRSGAHAGWRGCAPMLRCGHWHRGGLGETDLFYMEIQPRSGCLTTGI